ncbi:putative zinc ribbon protein [Klebsiella oxytoca]
MGQGQCQSHYQGENHCKTCKTEIYSISRGNWARGYNQKDNIEIYKYHSIPTQHGTLSVCSH